MKRSKIPVTRPTKSGKSSEETLILKTVSSSNANKLTKSGEVGSSFDDSIPALKKKSGIPKFKKNSREFDLSGAPLLNEKKVDDVLKQKSKKESLIPVSKDVHKNTVSVQNKYSKNMKSSSYRTKSEVFMSNSDTIKTEDTCHAISFPHLSANKAEDAIIEDLKKCIDLFDSNFTPSKAHKMLIDCTRVMSSFPANTVIIQILCLLIECLLMMIPTEELCYEVVAEYTANLFSVYSGEISLEGPEAEAAQDSVKNLIDTTFTLPLSILSNILSTIFLRSASDKKIKLILESLSEKITREGISKDDKYLIVISDLIYSQKPNYEIPSFLPQATASLAREKECKRTLNSILNTNRSIENIRRIVSQSQDGSFKEYPTYLRVILKATWRSLRQRANYSYSGNSSFIL